MRRMDHSLKHRWTISAAMFASITLEMLDGSLQEQEVMFFLVSLALIQALE